MYFYQYVRLDTKRMILSSILIQYLYLIPRFYSTRVIDDYLDDNEWKFRIQFNRKNRIILPKVVSCNLFKIIAIALISKWI